MPTNSEQNFKGKHLSALHKIDEDHHEYVEKPNSVNSNFNKNNDDIFEDEIIISELEQPLKKFPPTGSFESDNLHTLILKHLGSRVTQSVLHLSNKSWAKGIWPWNKSKDTFIRKPKINSTRNVLVSDH